MLNTILVPLDGSELAEGALTFATALSSRTRARLVLLRAVSVHTFPGVDAREPQVRALAEAETYLRTLADGLSEHGFEIEIAMPYGESPADWIVEEARLRNADLIVMTTHSRTGPGHLMFGSVAEAVVSQSPVPVLLQRAWEAPQRELEFGNQPQLLVSLDGSVVSESALDPAAGLATALNAGLGLVRVETTPTDLFAQENVGPQFDAEESSLRRGTQGYLHELSRALSERWPGVSVGTTMQFGDADAGVNATADEDGAAMVIMATHGQTGLLRAALGSVAGRVLEHGHTPLVLVGPAMIRPHDHGHEVEVDEEQGRLRDVEP